MAKHYMNNAYLSGENQIKNNKIVCYIFIGFFFNKIASNAIRIMKNKGTLGISSKIL